MRHYRFVETEREAKILLLTGLYLDAIATKSLLPEDDVFMMIPFDDPEDFGEWLRQHDPAEYERWLKT